MMLLRSGCLFRPPDELYKRPEKSAGYDQLASVIKEVRSGLSAKYGATPEDALIVAGDNTATIQLQDLDGDGQRESAVTFIRIPGAEKALKVYIFTQVGEDYQLTGIVEGAGASIYSVDYVDLNGTGYKELVINWQVGTGVYQLGAYTLDELTIPSTLSAQPSGSTSGDDSTLLATELLLTGCGAVVENAGSYSSGYQLTDIDQDGRTEIAVARVDTGGQGGEVELYGWENNGFISLGSASLSAGAATLNQMKANYLGGAQAVPALYVSATLADGSRTVDVLAYEKREGEGKKRLVNLSLDESGVSQNRRQSYTEVGLTDINGDGVLEIPFPKRVPVYGDASLSNFWLIEWSQYDEDGTCSEVMTTYHNGADGWFLELPDSWKGKITISRNDTLTGQRQVIFSRWDGGSDPPQPFLSIYRLTGSNRAARAEWDDRFILREEGEVIYAARFYDCDWDCGLIANDLMMRNFQTIQSSWYG
jgi:hypothetical protein